MIASGFFLLGAAPAQADVAAPEHPTPNASVLPYDDVLPAKDALPYGDPLGDALARTNGLRLSSPVGTDPLGRRPLLTLDQDNQPLFQLKPGQNDIAGLGSKHTESDRRHPMPAADVIGSSVHNAPGNRLNSSLKGVPFTDANTGSLRLPLLGSGRLPIIGGLLPDGSRTLESTSTESPALDDLDGDLSVRGLPKRLSNTNALNLAGFPLGGTPVPLLTEATPATSASPVPDVSASPAPDTSPYTSVAPARPGIASPSASAPAAPSDLPSASTPPMSGTIPSAAAVTPGTSEVPAAKIDDPRLLEEPSENLN